MGKVQLAIIGLYMFGSLLIFASIINWYWWIMWGQNIHLFWVIISGVLAAVVILQASVLVLQIVDKWYFIRKAERSSR
ncbi:hypothetical protein E2P63_05155 [Candidatus Bathyarchaeota archaeon]|nr:hypothetical protein E2P63_05155 [Candidatus Bathyarchaeota archaeon]